MKKILFGILFILFFCSGIDGVKAINSGTYKIVSALDENIVLTASDDGNIQINQNEDKESQLWDVIMQNDGSFMISSKLVSSKSIDVSGGSSLDNTNISLYNTNRTNAQKWFLKQAEDGFYYIVSKINGTSVMEFENNVNGGNVYLNKLNDSNFQKFKFIKVFNDEKVIEDGTYIINTKTNKELAISVDGNNVNLNKLKSNYLQAWNFKRLDDGYYEISPYSKENVFLNVESDTNYYKANVQIGEKRNKWEINKNIDGTYSIISDSGDYYLDIYGGDIKPKTNIWLYKGNGSNAQKFTFTEIEFPEIENGLYSISPFNNNLLLSLNNQVTFNGVNVELERNNDSNNQKWYFENIKENVYEIKSAIDGSYVFDIYNGSISNGGNLQIWKTNSSNAQRWAIIRLKDGYYRFTNINSGKVLDIYNGNISNGTNIWQYANNGTNAQKFTLNKTILSEYEQIIPDDDYILYSKLNLNKSVRSDSNVYLYDVEGSKQEIISIDYVKNGFYTLKIQNKAITNSAGKIITSNYIGSDSQLWYAIKDGNYYTFISKSNGKVLDVYGGNTVNKTKLHTYTSNGSNAQKFYLEAVLNKKMDSGYYSISSNNNYIAIKNKIPYTGASIITEKDDKDVTWYIKNIKNNLFEIRSALNPSKVLDVYGGNTTDGTKVWLYSSNSSAAQRWYMIWLKDGTVKFVSSKSHSVLTDYNNDVKIYSNSINKVQKFSINKIDSINYGKVIDEGYYTINSSLNNKKLLEVTDASTLVKTNVRLWSQNNDVSQIWNFKYLGDGVYAIISALNPKRALTVYDGNVVIDKYTKSEGQKWYIVGLENDKFSIVSAYNGSYIDVYGGSSTNGTNIWTYSGNGSNAQKFILNKYQGTKSYKGIDISKWQGNINWSLLVKKNPQFIIMRVGRGLGDLGKDIKFEEYYKNATNYDIPVGVYIYGFATNLNEAKKEADYVLDWLDNKNLDLPVFYDMEYSGLLYLGKDVLTEIADSFCNTIVSNNYHCGIYANIYWLNSHLNGKKLSEKYPIWLAHWTGANDYDTVLNDLEKYKSPYGLSPYQYWQFSSLGKYPGITENTVDLDFGYDIFD